MKMTNTISLLKTCPRNWNPQDQEKNPSAGYLNYTEYKVR